MVLSGYPASARGALRVVTNAGRDAMDASDLTGRVMSCADGKSVWSRFPDAGIKPADDHRRATEAIKPGTPERARHKP
jgi:hypothetical protein